MSPQDMRISCSITAGVDDMDAPDYNPSKNASYDYFYDRFEVRSHSASSRPSTKHLAKDF